MMGNILTSILKYSVVILLAVYFVSRVSVSLEKLKEHKIGTASSQVILITTLK